MVRHKPGDVSTHQYHTLRHTCSISPTSAGVQETQSSAPLHFTVIEPPTFGIASEYPEVATIIEKLKRVFRSLLTPEAFLIGFMKVLGQNIAEPVRLLSQQYEQIAAMRQEPEPWEIPLPLGALADLSCPKLVVSGDWHPAFLNTADRLAQGIRAERLIIKGAGHETQRAGTLFNDRLHMLMQLA